jgi:signal transduction histidine kinase
MRLELKHCGCEEAVRDFFLLDLLAEHPASEPADLPPALRAWLAEVLFLEVQSEAQAAPGVRVMTEQLRFRVGQGQRIEMRVLEGSPVAPGRRSTVVRTLRAPAERAVYALLYGSDGRPVAAYGFVVEVPALVEAVARDVVSSAALLPPSLTGGAANEDFLALAVRLAEGEPVYRTTAPLSPSTRVADTLHTEWGALVTEVSTRPEVASALVIGGLPGSRLPLLLAVLGLALGLMGVAAAQLRRQRALARLRGDFVAGVSHELRTPLAQIQLFAELLETDRLRPDQRERSVRVIREEARRLTYLVENVLRFSGAERGAARILPEPTDLAPAVRDVVESFAPLARSRDATLEVSLAEGLRAPVDRSALRQVLLNLLDNAVKYGPRGQRVRVRLAAQGRGVQLSVSDEGPGVPPAERERIWQPYRRLRRDAESAAGGSGIGLSVVRDLVELHGGEVAVGDAPGGGARFEVWLPGPIERSLPQPEPLAEATP